MPHKTNLSVTVFVTDELKRLEIDVANCPTPDGISVNFKGSH
jgi:hypothetical protein